MLCEPRAECGGYIKGSLGLLEETGILADWERRLDGVQELDWERVALVHIGDVDVEAIFGVIISEKTNVLEFPSED